MASRKRQIACDVFIAFWEQLSAGCEIKAVQSSRGKTSIPTSILGLQ
jgi:hypothetical protein